MKTSYASFRAKRRISLLAQSEILQSLSLLQNDKEEVIIETGHTATSACVAGVIAPPETPALHG